MTNLLNAALRYRVTHSCLLSLLSTTLLFCSVGIIASPAQAEDSEVFVDAIVASVNGIPITLTDVVKRAGVPYPSSLSAASQDERIQFTLQQLITEQLLRAEAQERRLSVSPEELDRYIERVAQQNGLTPAEFEDALKAENKTLTDYKQTVEIDILRTKLASSLLRQGITVGDKEIDEYMEQHAEFGSEGSKIKLRQILLSKSKHSAANAKEELLKIKASTEDLDDFVEAAQKYSDGPEAEEGGLLGVFQEEELSGDIFDALFKLKSNSLSDIVETPQGYHLFYVETRYVGDDEKDDDEQSESLRNEVRAELEKQKMDEKLRLYFAQELSTKFAVDKKI